MPSDDLPAGPDLPLAGPDLPTGPDLPLAGLWRRLAGFGLEVVLCVATLGGAVTLGLGWAIGAAFVLSPSKQAMWDRLAFTTVVQGTGAVS